MADSKQGSAGQPEIEELPDAWERFERAFDTVIKAPAERKRALLPKTNKRPASKGRSKTRT
jgi:hypothetical protein